MANAAKMINVRSITSCYAECNGNYASNAKMAEFAIDRRSLPASSLITNHSAPWHCCGADDLLDSRALD